MTTDAPSTGLLNGRFVAYRYEPRAAVRRPARTGRPRATPARAGGRGRGPSFEGTTPPFPQLPSGRRRPSTPGRTYLCAEMVVRHEMPDFGELVYLVLVEVETGSILYIECQTCFVSGMVFKYDPQVSSGDLTVDVRRR